MGAYLVWYAPVLVVGLIVYNSFLDNSPSLYIRDKTLRVPLYKRRRSLRRGLWRDTLEILDRYKGWVIRHIYINSK